MSKWRKRIPILVVVLSALALCVAALSFATTEDQKEDYIQQQNALRSISQTETLHPDVAAKLAMEAEIQAKLEAEEEGDEEEIPLKAAYSTKDNELGTSSIAGHPVVKYAPGSVAFEQDFEGAEFPPPGWDTINTDPGYGFFLGTYSGGGTQAALVTWHAAGFQQDEWLLSPTVNLSGYTSALRLEFWFLQGYSYPHDFKIYVDVGSGMTEIWDSDTTGYPSFTWWKYTIDMSAYIDETVQIGFQYYGVDADLFGIDDIVLTDEAAAVGRCCYGDPAEPSCDDVTEAECEAMGGYSWDGDLNCTDNPCPIAPDNDDCHDVTPDALPATWTGNNDGATYDGYCQWFGDYPNVWHAFTIEECMDITIEYCGCPPGWANAWLNLVTDCDCPDGALISYTSFDWDCANGNPRIYFTHLEAGTYYYPVMLDPSSGAVGDYELYVYGDPCPPAPENDDCASAEEIGDVTDYPFSTATATPDGNGYTTSPNIWYCYTATCTGDATASLCGSSYDTKMAAYDGCSCDPLGTLLASNDDFCGVQSEVTFDVVEGNLYLIEVGGYGSASGDGLLSISCEVTGPSEPGDDCDNPLMVDIPSSLPWCDNGQTTCGRGNSYEDPDDEICMGYYTNGEDIFYEITVASPVTVNFHLDPKGNTYAGMGLFTSCPPTLTNCVDFETSYTGDPKSMTCVSLEPGVYYLMIDTWSTPYCIPEFDLCIVDTTCEALENDDCANATEINEVVDLAFSTDAATFDGGGTCLSSPNIWYCYTATETGNATISLCGSDYDTKMAVYDGCTCEPLGTELACNDDACGAQSEVEIPVTAGNSYLVEVGGYSSNTGTGILNISVSEPPPPCVVECPPGAFTEPEPCGDDVNGGCNMAVPAFTPIDCEDTVCGTIWADGGTRDTDWYELVLTELTLVTWSGVGEFPFVIGFVDTADCALAAAMDPYAVGDPCDTISCSRTCGPGIYWLFASHQDYYDLPCDDNNDYWCAVSCEPAVPTYCEASGGCDEYIENVTFETINNTTGCDMYGDYTALSAPVETGNSYPITITTANGYSSDTGAVYVDWNQDLDFNDPGEVGSLNPGAGIGPYSGTVTVPGDALLGETRMRIRLSWNTDPVPCGTQTYGEVEDYTINVGGEPAVTYLFEPDPVYVLYKFAIDPMNGFLYLSGDAVGGDVGDMTDISLEVRECDVPITATEIIPGGYGELTGDVLKLTFGITEYIECEENGSLIYGEIESFFDVYYDLDGTPSEMEGQVTVIGHTSGDLNLDGKVNVADLSYLAEYLFTGGPAPEILELADVDGSGGNPNVGDLTYLVEYLFNDGPPPMHQ